MILHEGLINAAADLVLMREADSVLSYSQNHQSADFLEATIKGAREDAAAYLRAAFAHASKDEK